MHYETKYIIEIIQNIYSPTFRFSRAQNAHQIAIIRVSKSDEQVNTFKPTDKNPASSFTR